MMAMGEKQKLIIFGDSAFAEVAYEYFSFDSDYQVVCFAVERPYLKPGRTLFGLDVLPIDELNERFSAEEHYVYVAITYGQLNRVRAQLLETARNMGYKLASYISSRAFVWRNAKIGDHAFIMEGNVIQPFVEIGSNVVLWSGNHIGHHSVIGDNCFVSSHVIVSGFSRIGANCFLGVNSTVSNNLNVADDCWVGPSVTIAADTQPGQLFRDLSGVPSKVSTLRFFKVQS